MIMRCRHKNSTVEVGAKQHMDGLRFVCAYPPNAVLDGTAGVEEFALGEHLAFDAH